MVKNDEVFEEYRDNVLAAAFMSECELRSPVGSKGLYAPGPALDSRPIITYIIIVV